MRAQPGDDARAATPTASAGTAASRSPAGRPSTGSTRPGSSRTPRPALERRAAAAAGRDAPDPATVLSIATGPRRRLWERRRTDPDYLLLRVGTAGPALRRRADRTRPRTSTAARSCWSIPDAPVTVPLTERGVLGVAGPGDVPRALGRWLVAQIAVLHSPDDVQICVLTDSAGQAELGVGPVAAALPASSRAGLRRADRQRRGVGRRHGSPSCWPRSASGRRRCGESAASGARCRFGSIVVVLDGLAQAAVAARRAARCCGTGPPVGVYAICLDAEERLLPAECQAVAVAGPRRAAGAADDRPTADRGPAGPASARPGARGWPGRSPRSGTSAATRTTPGCRTSSRLLDVLGLEPPDAASDRRAAGGPAAGPRWR